MQVAVVGGSAAGLFAALLLARRGHGVLVLDQDRLEPAPDVESAAASAFRVGAPQIVQPHIVMARGRALLRERLPDLCGELLAAGVVEAPLPTQMPPTLSDRTARPGDEQLTTLMTRRSTVDWALGRAARAEPGLTVRHGVRVLGLLAAPGRPPRVVGLRTDQGDVGAELVIDAMGRRSPLDRWLGEIGARPTALQRAECGVAYFSRHYRLRPGAALPGLPTTRLVAGLDELTVGIWGGDNGAMQLVVAPLAADHRFRTLRSPDVFTAVLRTLPAYAAWLDAMDPISGVFPMGALHNTLRRLVVDGAPVVAGLHAVGDSVCTTNPTFGRGLGLALQGAVDLADAVEQHGDDPVGQALALDALLGDHAAPFYEDQAATDAARLAVLRHAVFDAPAPARPPLRPDRVTYAQLRAAAPHDPVAFRAFWRVMGMVGRPDDTYLDRSVVAATHETLRRHRDAPPPPQPTRAQLLDALGS